MVMLTLLRWSAWSMSLLLVACGGGAANGSDANVASHDAAPQLAIAAGRPPDSQLPPSLPIPTTGDAWRTLGVIDMEAAVLATADGQRARSSLKTVFDSRQAELENRKRVLVEEQEMVARMKPASTEAQRRQADLQVRMRQLQEAYLAFQQELKDREAALTGPILVKMRSVVQDVAARRGMRFVLDKQAIPVSPPENDLTDEAIRAYEASATKPKAKP